MGFLERMQEKLELYRLEQRYTRRKNRSEYEAQYIDGEYIYTTPSSAGSGAQRTTAKWANKIQIREVGVQREGMKGR
ncbi:hypothetical protein MMC34_006824 [Xylographa carneopallida]|nr:hypothetical protein [Xylographa carneopallida]